MSISYRAYCGPYLRCTKKFTTQENKRPGCVNNVCPNSNNEVTGRGVKFCPQCGKAIGLFTVSKQVQVGRNLWELFDGKEPFTNVFAECGPKLIRDKYDILVSNYQQYYDPDCEDEDTRRQFSVYVRDHSVCQDLTDTNPKVEIAEFEKKNAKDIAKLREAYGPTEVVLCWGFLTWSS